FDFVIACGPTPMLRAVQKIASLFRLSGQISLESYMACGVGACLGCVCQTEQGSRRVCVDGPVFPIEEVIL
ncbi:MAG: dihydroorotate dehydrogenase electron transfer subunit, partial [Firmicutes bacterium]|nr:dihydroorotate dehydrogenase electron transfer subunit [Bacillota bacterium]